MATSTGFTFIGDTFQFIDSFITQGIGQYVTTISSSVGLVMASGTVFYAVIMGYRVLLGQSSDLFKDFISTLVTLAIVSSIALNTSFYMNHIVPFVLHVGDEIGSKLINNGDSSKNALDIFLTQIYFTIKSIWEQASFGTDIIVSSLNILIILVGTIPFITTAFAILLTAKMMVALLLTVGTIFICFAFFKELRGWFTQWLNMCWNYILIAMLFPIALAFEQKAIEMFILKNGAIAPDLTTALKISVLLLAFMIISTQIPVLASSLSGGVGINGMSGSFSSVVGGMKALSSPISSMMQVGKWAKNDISKDINAIKNNLGNNIKAG